MKSFLATLSALLLLAVPLAAEEAKPLSQEQLEAIAIQPVRNWKSTNHVVPEMLSLFKAESIKFGGSTLNYRLHVPENFEADKKYPLILWLHGAGETGNDNKLQLVHLHHIITSLTGEKKRDFFLLVPQCLPGTGWSYGGGSTYSSVTAVPSDVREGKKTLEEYKKELLGQTKAASPGAEVEITEEKATTGSRGGLMGMMTKEPQKVSFLRVTVTSAEDNHPLAAAFAMVEQALGKYPVDKNRITVSGLSTGGDGTWRALERRPDLFAAAVPLVSWDALTDAAMEKSPILKKIPIWAIYSSDDGGIDRARTDFERVEKAGANVKKTEFGICGHNAWTPAMLQADIFSWLLSRAKDGERYYAVYDPGVDPDKMKGIVDVATHDPGKPALAPAVEKQPSGTTIMPAVPLQALPTTIDRPAQSRQQFVAEMEAQREPQMQQYRTAVPRVAPQGISMPWGGQIAQFDRPPMVFEEEIVLLPDGSRHVRSRPMPSVIAPSPEKDEAYTALAEKHFMQAQMQVQVRPQETDTFNAFKNCVRKMSPKAQIRLIEALARDTHTIGGLKVLEELLDNAPIGPILQQPFVPRVAPTRAADVSPPVAPRSISAEKIIEECNRPWAMTSESLYGMFPADWHKEAEAIPNFIVNSNTEDLAKQLAKSVGEDPESKDFVAACRSILLLQHKPMSSPWFETGGGRLRSDIQYSLSAKGQMFVRFLRTMKDSGNNSDKAKELSKVAEKTLEKIEMVLTK